MEGDNPTKALLELQQAMHPMWVSVPGFSLRDWFAGMALQGLLAHGDHTPAAAGVSGWAQRATMAYAQADAMLTERERA